MLRTQYKLDFLTAEKQKKNKRGQENKEREQTCIMPAERNNTNTPMRIGKTTESKIGCENRVGIPCSASDTCCNAKCTYKPLIKQS